MAAAPKHCTACSLFALGLAGYARIFLQLVFTIVLQMRRSGSRGSQDVHSVPQHNSRASGRVCVCVCVLKEKLQVISGSAGMNSGNAPSSAEGVCVYL